MTAAKELKKLNKQIKAIGAMFQCSCCEDTLENNSPEDILEQVVLFIQKRIEEQEKIHGLN